MPGSEGLLEHDNVKVRRRELSPSLHLSLPQGSFGTQRPQKGKMKMKTPSSQTLWVGEGRGSPAHSCFVEFQELRFLPTEKGQRKIPAPASPTFYLTAVWWVLSALQQYSLSLLWFWCLLNSTIPKRERATERLQTISVTIQGTNKRGT